MNYKETALAGTSWVRCRAITITNPLAGTEETDQRTGLLVGPTAFFTEEKVVTMDGADLRVPSGYCSKAFNPEDTITLINPETGEVTGATVTHGALYEILYSLYMQTALERDTLTPN